MINQSDKRFPQIEQEVRGSRVLIAGFGREGQSVWRFLRKYRPELKLAIADENDSPRINDAIQSDPAWSNAEQHFGTTAWESVSQYDTVIRSPGIHPDTLKHAGARHITSATNLFFATQYGDAPQELAALEHPGSTQETGATHSKRRSHSNHIVGVTGTKGKSTTAALISHALQQSFTDVRLVGNIGTPMLDHLNDASDDTWFVLELSSYQLIDCKYSPQLAVLLNIVPEHLNYHGDFEAYRQAKANITRHQTSQDIVVFNPAHAALSPIVSASLAEKLTYSLQRPESSSKNENANKHTDTADTPLAWLENDTLVLRNFQAVQAATAPATEALEPLEAVLSHTHSEDTAAEPLERATNPNNRVRVPLSQLQIIGAGNTENALAAATVALRTGVPATSVATGLKTFQPLPHRLEPVGVYNGIHFVNDSLSTIPQAAINAVRGLTPPVHTLIVGGFDRGVSQAPLVEFLNHGEHSLGTIIGLPTTGHTLIEQLRNSTSQKHRQVRLFCAETLEEAVKLAHEHTPTGTTCVLSPAAASFHQFADYAERGEAFRRLARREP